MPEEKSKYFVVKLKAVPEVLLKVVEAKKLLESERVMTVQEATERVGISRSSFYKYKEDIFPFYDNTKGKTVLLWYRWMMNRACFRTCFISWQFTKQTS